MGSWWLGIVAGDGRQLVGLGKTRESSSYEQDVANWKRGGEKRWRGERKRRRRTETELL